ncbi:helix-turn-helix domain-containing protein [Oligoflexus tunisiensis]|uniref:helix-turn-helix domain-containing protein n=1 Tax=Oligoflexus tunisiensis TaxID=708132 RepID=UPI00114CCF53|nr:helix-turn-helix domain-containing protein [Oligoflexus tunisiensis]
MPIVRDKQKRNEIRATLYQALSTNGMEVSDVVKSLRKMMAKGQEAFADHIDISLATLRKIEQKRGNFTMDSIRKILDRFDLVLVVKTKGSCRGNPPQSQANKKSGDGNAE